MPDSPYCSSTAWRLGGDSRSRRRGHLDKRSRSFRFQWAAGQKLSKEYFPDLVPGDFLETWPPAQDEDTNWYVEKKYGKDIRKVPVAWISHESIRYATLPKSSWHVLLLRVFAKYIIILGAAALFIDFLAIVFFGGRSLEGYITNAYIPAILYIGGPCALIWGAISLIERLFPSVIYKDPKGPLWEFNRRTGLVTVFRNPKKKRDAGQIAWQSPFSEFDGYVHSGPTHRGCRSTTVQWFTDIGKKP